MTEEQVRALVRDALARHLGTTPRPDRHDLHVQHDRHDRHDVHDRHDARRAAAHIAHGRFVFLAPSEPDAPCIVEPQVKCHHCGFCQSYGH